MKSYTKVGLLITLLIIPALVFVFLKVFAKNHFSIPIYYAMDSVKTDNGFKVTKAHTIPSFSLVSQEGEVVKSEQFIGSIKVVDFFFTRCPGICPKMSNQLSRVQEVFADEKDLKILSISVDPVYDVPDTLKLYSQKYKALSQKWFFLTGTKDSIYTLAQKGFFITAMEDKNHPVDFIHSDKVVLVDKKGWIRGYYNGTDKKDIDRLIDEIRVLKGIENE